MTSISTIPRGFKQCLSKYSSPFDKEILQDDDKELWLIRIPDNISEKDLEQLKLKVPTATTTSKLPKLEKDNNKYALYKVPTDNFSSSSSSSSNSIDNDKAQNDVGISGQEMLSFDCLVPSLDKPFEHCLILDEIVDIPDSTALAESIRDSPIYKREQPEGLKLRFLPTGYFSREDEKSEEEKNKKRSLEEEDVKEPVKKVKKEKKDKKKKKEKK
ncbi:hypothetical protein RMCBS344292_14399 [Rhizopus microsporus]|nr:hypothetical protein RMCBS344292_14399 [Rhizopus microsporus]